MHVVYAVCVCVRVLCVFARVATYVRTVVLSS